MCGEHDEDLEVIDDVETFKYSDRSRIEAVLDRTAGGSLVV